MASDYLRTGSIIGPPLEYTTQDRLLAEIKPTLVELLHEQKTANDLARTNGEILRKLALKVEKISLQTHVCAVQLGRLVERT